MTLTLKPDAEGELSARAKTEGFTTEEFVNRELEKLGARKQASPELSAEERARILEDWIANHSCGGPPLSDYAVSRESIYKEREDAQL